MLEKQEEASALQKMAYVGEGNNSLWKLKKEKKPIDSEGRVKTGSLGLHERKCERKQ